MIWRCHAEHPELARFRTAAPFGTSGSSKAHANAERFHFERNLYGFKWQIQVRRFFQSCLPNLQATTFKNQPTKLIQLIVNLRLNFHSDSWNFLRSPASMTKGSEPATPPAPTDNLLATGGDHRKKFLDLLCVKIVSEHEGNSAERFIHLARILGRLVLEDIYTTIRI